MGNICLELHITKKYSKNKNTIETDGNRSDDSLTSTYIMPETSFHAVETFIAADVGQIESRNLSWALIAENETFHPGRRRPNAASCTALPMVSTLSRAELQLSSCFHWAAVLTEIHSLQIFSCKPVKVALFQACIR